MNIRLQSLMNEAETRLGEADQDRLAELLETFLAVRGTGADFSAEEVVELRSLDQNRVELATDDAVAALFGRRA